MSDDQVPNPLAAAVPAARPTGTVSWAMGFLSFIPLPVVGLLVAGIVMTAIYPSARKHGEPGTSNARNAANWGLTVLTLLVVLVVVFIVLMATLSQSTRGFFPIGWPVVGYLVLALVHFIVTIVGVVKASRGAVFRNPLAIPYLR